MKHKCQITVLFSILAILAVLSYPPRVTTVQGANASPGSISGQETLSKDKIRAVVKQEAVIYGISPNRADFILNHESQYCGWDRDGKYEPDIKGDDGDSIGCWQVYLKAHSDPTKQDFISPACASNLLCSTDWSFRMMDLGYISWWSTWKCRYHYKDGVSVLGPMGATDTIPSWCSTY